MAPIACVVFWCCKFVRKSRLMKKLCRWAVVSVFPFYYDDPGLNPAEVDNFYIKLLLKRTKISKKRPGLGHKIRKFCCTSNKNICVWTHSLLFLGTRYRQGIEKTSHSTSRQQGETFLIIFFQEHFLAFNVK